MKSNKSQRGKKPAKSASARPRWPKGHPQAGKFAPAELFKEYQKNVRREEKNRRERERRQRIRDERRQLAAPAMIGGEFAGWGTASTSRLREGTTYTFHGAFRVLASGDVIGRILQDVGSSAKRPRATGDGNYEIILTPQLGNFTPAEFFEGGAGASYDGAWFADQFGGRAEFLGAFWRDSE